jgi:ribosomal protein S18 acetylase RimI-like enzyme
VKGVLALDNPVYSSLTGDHASLALGDGRARRYPRDVSPLTGLAEPTAEAFADLRALTEPGETVATVTIAPVVVPGDWELVGERWIDQMVLDAPAAAPAAAHELVELGAADATQMLALAQATQPGPFALGTVRMGRYLGIRDGERLVAMAGERMRPEGATEISAVCTDPAYTGRGYAKALMAPLIAAAVEAGRTPMLHVKTENGAKRLYERLGFRVRREMRLTIITRPR